MNNRPFTGKTVSKKVTSTTAGAGADLVYVVPDRHEAEITFFAVSNADSGNRKISIQIKDNGSYGHLVKEKNISAGQLVPLITSDRIYLSEGDEIRAYKEAGTYDIIVSVSVKQYARTVRRT